LLPEALDRVGGLYRRDLKKYYKVILDVALPVWVVGLGCITLTVNFALFHALVALFNEGATW